MATVVRSVGFLCWGTMLGACGGSVDATAPQSSPSWGFAGNGGSTSAVGFNLAGSGGITGTVETSGVAGAATSSPIQCAWEQIQCGILEPTCAATETFALVAACSGPCVSVDSCPPRWAPRQDLLTVGVWLIGQQDPLKGTPNYSVLRFGSDFSLEFSVPNHLMDSQPYFPCQGMGDWAELQLQGAIHVGNPGGCTLKSVGLRFVAFHDANGRWGATMRAEILGGGVDPMEGYWFPEGTCAPTAADCPL